MNNQIKRPKPNFTLEFKQDAVKLITEKGYTHQQAADSLGISLSAIGRWSRAERGSANITSTKTTGALNLVDHAELLRLRKENEQLRMERDILKKAAVFYAPEGIFAKDAGYPGGTSKIRVYPEATEDLSCYRVMSCDAGQHQCFLRVVKETRRYRQSPAKSSARTQRA